MDDFTDEELRNLEMLDRSGFSLEDIATRLRMTTERAQQGIEAVSSIIEVRELAESASDDYSFVIPFLESLDKYTKTDLQANLFRTAVFISQEVLKSLNSPEKLTQLGRATVVLEKLGTVAARLPATAQGEDDNAFTKYLKD